jgi:hypothetical protein
MEAQKDSRLIALLVRSCSFKRLLTFQETCSKEFVTFNLHKVEQLVMDSELECFFINTKVTVATSNSISRQFAFRTKISVYHTLSCTHKAHQTSLLCDC